MRYELPMILHRLHVASGMSQEATVAMIKRRTSESMHQTAFSHYMATDDRQRVPSVATAAAIAKAFDVSIDYLLGETTDRRRVVDLIDRIRELTFPATTERAANLLTRMPEAYQKKHLAAIEADFGQVEIDRRWRLIEKFLPPSEIARIIAAAQVDDRIGDTVADDDGVIETLFELA